jgi:hypothetical protein
MNVTITQESTETQATTSPTVGLVSLEVVLYLLLAALALTLRFAELDSVPMTVDEARQGLAAWRVVFPEAPGGYIVAESPLLFLLHQMSFSTLGASEFSARIWTALAGAGLIFTPVLFRELLGRGRTFAFCFLLAFSPVLLTASRFDSPVVWSMLFVALALWGVWRYWKTQRQGYGLLAMVMLVSVVLLADPAGFALAMMVVGAGWLALSLSQSDNPEADLGATVREKLRDWPWLYGLVLGGVIVALVSTGFLFYQPGLSSVSGLLTAGFSGIAAAKPGAPLFFPLVTAIVYEPVLWLFGLITVLLLSRRGMLGFVERFFALWALLGALAGAFYQGGGPAHALWMIVPLAGLSASLAGDVLQKDENALWDVPWWATWLVALGMIALLLVFTINLQTFGREIIETVDGSIFLAAQRTPMNVIWLLVAILFIVVGYFLAAGVWTDRTALRGMALGLLLLSAVTSLASGWRASVTDYDNAAELWHVQATSREVPLLAESLNELKERQSRGFPEVPLVALAPDDGVVAWLLRDFTKARFISSVEEAKTQEIALLPQTFEPPDLDGAYVGQTFVISRVWGTQPIPGFEGQTIYPGDWIGWWSQLQTRTPAIPLETMVLWLRQDIYDGIPFEGDLSIR